MKKLLIILVTAIFFVSCKPSQKVSSRNALQNDFLNWYFDQFEKTEDVYYLTQNDWFLENKTFDETYQYFVFEQDYLIAKSKQAPNFFKIDIKEVLAVNNLKRLENQAQEKLDLTTVKINSNKVNIVKTKPDQNANFSDIQKTIFISKPLFTNDNNYCFLYVNVESFVKDLGGAAVRLYKKNTSRKWESVGVFLVEKHESSNDVPNCN